MKGSGIVQVRDLQVDLEEFHLRRISLDVGAGEYFVILGPTGSGKTVLLESIAGLQRPSKGRIILDGEDITDVPPERRSIGLVYQDYALFPHLSVAENIAFGLRTRKRDRRTVEQRVTAIAQLLGVDHLLPRAPDMLSGGEQQQVALARALVVEPRLLLLDEPLSALDPETKEGLQRKLAQLHRKLGTTTLHVTHDLEEAVALGERIAVMNGGQVVQVGSSAEIFRRPRSEFVARFMGVINVFRGEVRTGKDGYKVVLLDLAADGSTGLAQSSERCAAEIAVVTDLMGQVHASIRPEEIVIFRYSVHSSARNCFRGHIVDVVDRGATVLVTVRVPPDFTCMITRRSLEEMELTTGMEVYIAFKASAVHVF